jgi:enoyl-CoA hydratase/carnithine racemase
MFPSKGGNNLADDILLTEKKDGIWIVTLNRPEVMNAVNRDLLMSCNQLAKEAYYAEDLRVVIITGAGDSAFCSGADLKERKVLKMGEVRQFIQVIRDTFSLIENLPRPVIAAINGLALGGGTEMALACDMRVADPAAKMGLTEVKWGITPGGGGTQRLPRLVGKGVAKEMIFTGKVIDAQEAYRIGLINKISEPGKVMDTALEIAREICENAPIAVAQAKSVINRGMEMDINNALQIETNAYEVVIPTKDRIEGLKAFLDKRKPDYKNE